MFVIVYSSSSGARYMRIIQAVRRGGRVQHRHVESLGSYNEAAFQRYRKIVANESQIAVQLMNELALSPAESCLLSRRMARWLQRKREFRAPNQIVVEASSGRERFIRNGKGQVVNIKLTPYEQEDLKFELEFGLKRLQAGRIAWMIEQAYDQVAFLSIRKLTWHTNITPASLRARLASFRGLGIYPPYLGLSRSARREQSVLRST